MQGTDDRDVEFEQLQAALLAPVHEAVMGQIEFAIFQRTGVATRRPALPLTLPEHHAQVRVGADFSQNLKKLRVHRVIEGIMLVAVVVGDGGDAAIDFEKNFFCDHARQLTAPRLCGQSYSCCFPLPRGQEFRNTPALITEASIPPSIMSIPMATRINPIKRMMISWACSLM